MRRHHKPSGEKPYSPTKCPFWIENITNAAGNIQLTHIGPTTSAMVFQYSTNGTTWTTWSTSSSNIINLSIPAGTRYYIRASRTYGFFSKSDEDYRHIFLSGTAAYRVGGYLASLMTSSWENVNSISRDYCFYKLFMECTTLRDAGELILPKYCSAQYCYYQMFNYASGLVTAPILPYISSTSGYMCCYRMFFNCRSLAFIDARHVTGAANIRIIFKSFIYDCAYNGIVLCSNSTTATQLRSSDTEGGLVPYSTSWQWLTGDACGNAKQYMYITTPNSTSITNGSYMAFSHQPYFGFSLDYKLLNTNNGSGVTRFLFGTNWNGGGAQYNFRAGLSWSNSANKFEVGVIPNSTVSGDGYAYKASGHSNNGYDTKWHKISHGGKVGGLQIFDEWSSTLRFDMNNIGSGGAYWLWQTDIPRYTSNAAASATTNAGLSVFRYPLYATNKANGQAAAMVSNVIINGKGNDVVLYDGDTYNIDIAKCYLPFEINGQIGMVNVCGTDGNTMAANFIAPTNPSGSCTLSLDTRIS